MYQPKSHRWSSLKHTSDGFWIFGTDHIDKPVVTPFQVRLTAANGETLQDHIPRLGKNQVNCLELQLHLLTTVCRVTLQTFVKTEIP